MEKLLDEIESYWSTRTEGYSEVNHKELAGTQKNAWLKVLTSQFPDKPKEKSRRRSKFSMSEQAPDFFL